MKSKNGKICENSHIRNEKLYKRLIGVAYKTSGAFTEADRDTFRRTMCNHLTDGGFLMTMGTDEWGRGMLFCFDIYVVEQLGIYKRLRHSLRVFFAAVVRNVGIRSLLRVVVLE